MSQSDALSNRQMLDNFAAKHHIYGLSQSVLAGIYEGKYDLDRAHQFMGFKKRIALELLNHKVIVKNPYTAWFEQAELTENEVRHFLVQFSVFSNQFLIAQLYKMLNAPTLEEMHTSKEILVNELGVMFNDIEPDEYEITRKSHHFKGTTGSAEGGVFHFKAAHFELLVRLANHVDLEFSDLGRRELGSQSTLFFCDELVRLYGSSDYTTANSASFSIENWAAAGFWDQLVCGLENYKHRNNLMHFPLAFFTLHSALEANHARHTQEELAEFYFLNEFDEDHYISRGNDMLNALYVFWAGLNQGRKKLLH